MFFMKYTGIPLIDGTAICSCLMYTSQLTSYSQKIWNKFVFGLKTPFLV